MRRPICSDRGRGQRPSIEPVEARLLLSGAALLADINVDTADSSPSQFVAFGGDTLFITSGGPARQLWKTDGTAGGTVLVKTLPNQADTTLFPRLMPALSGVALFFAPDAEHGNELWRTDGTPGGTYLLKDINPGAGSSPRPPSFVAAQAPDNPFVIDNVLYFQATDGTSGLELWRSDGTVDGTYRVKDIWGGLQGSGISRQAVANGILYFSAGDGSGTSPKLFRSDGTEAGTYVVSNTLLGPREMTAVGDDLFFIAAPSGGGGSFVLYKTDGVAAPVALSGPLSSVSGNSVDPIGASAAVGGIFFFTASDGTSGTELWKSDGTPGGTGMVKDLRAGATGALPRGLVDNNDLLYFTADDGVIGRELYTSDGTADGTVLVEDIRPGAASGFVLNPRLVSHGGAVYFSASDGATGSELWRSAGTAATTDVVRDVIAGIDTFAINDLRSVNGALYLSGNDLSHGFEPWRSDGTSGGTALLKDLNTTQNLSGTPMSMTTIGNVTYFAASRGTTGSELWRSDGTRGGTYLVKDINPGAASSDPENFVEMNGVVYFTATTLANGSELWRTDGTTAGTYLVKDIFVGPSNGTLGPLVPVGNTLFLNAGHAPNDYELWKSDGTEAGTVRVKDITPGAGNSNVSQAVAFNGELYFTYGWATYELWKSNGTDAGTVRVKPVGGPTNVTGLTLVGNTLYFAGTDSTNGAELWKSDGTAGGTVMVRDIHTSGSSTPEKFVAFNGRVYFWATTAAHGAELWSTDGTGPGTMLVKDVRPGPTSSHSSGEPLVAGGDWLYFGANDGTHLYELWQTDGTEANTRIVKELSTTGSSIISPPRMLYVNGLLYFIGISDAGGVRLWQTDGTEAGTTLAADVFPTYGIPITGTMAALNGSLVFSASNGVHGSELWTLAPMAPAWLAPSAGSAHALLGDTLTISGGTVTLTADAALAHPDLHVTVIGSSANAVFATTQHFASLTITGNGAAARLAAGGDKLLHVRGLTISSGGLLDLADNDLLWDYAPGEDPYATAFAYAQAGRATGTSGIVAAPGAGDVALAVVDNAVFHATTFGGVEIDATTIIGKYTYFGDANLDGKVTSDDYVAVDVNLGGASKQWFHGDFNFSGTVTSDDYVAIDVNLGKGTADALAPADPLDLTTPAPPPGTTQTTPKKPKSHAAVPGKKSGRGG